MLEGARLLFQHLPDPPPPPEAKRVQEKLQADQAARGGNRHAVRRLPRILKKEVGFTPLTCIPMMKHSDILGMEAVSTQLPPGLPDSFAERGVISADERDTGVADLEAFHTDPDALAIVTHVAASGEKPALPYQAPKLRIRQLRKWFRVTESLSFSPSGVILSFRS